ncbi:MAG: OsmC family peroxiredoxin [Streptosporangiaceae bacterium]
MATIRTANAHWQGPLAEGKGTVSLDSSGVGRFEVSWPSRSEQPNGQTSPEEMIAGAHATCYSMALSNGLGGGTPPETVDTRADVTFQAGQGITGIHLTARARVPGISAEAFAEAAEQAKANCPVSKALAGVSITLDAQLVS